jgi:hypothetical protein
MGYFGAAELLLFSPRAYPNYQTPARPVGTLNTLYTTAPSHPYTAHIGNPVIIGG